MISIESAAKVTGPCRTATLPTSNRRSRRKAKIHTTPVNTPAAMASIHTAEHQRFSSLEDQSHADRQFLHRSHYSTKQTGGVRIMATGMRDIRHRRGIRGADTLR